MSTIEKTTVDVTVLESSFNKKIEDDKFQILPIYSTSGVTFDKLSLLEQEYIKEHWNLPCDFDMVKWIAKESVSESDI